MFGALADPTRRQLLEQLAIGPTTANGLSVDRWWGTRGSEIEFASPSEEPRLTPVKHDR